ncbi:MAG: sugar transferase [Dinoroseobacter sp.]|nr:sugar transferase [Dinoroseobacter sp.]MDJ0993282.1 sugar transferase [Dinoroseobacter sp.]
MTIRANDVSESIPVSAFPSASTPKPSFYSRTGKRAFDVAAVLLSAPFVVPIVLVLAILVALDGHNPFYWQRRVGRKGRSFQLLKLRTMVVNADAKLEQYLSKNPDARAEWDAHQKLKNDPRITLFGRILRKSSLDELTQLWNVLKGDMSLVGPRPMMESQREMYPGTSYYRLRPGITGPWQISDRNACSFRRRASFDEAYAREVSLRSDLYYLGQTVFAVARCTGY